MTVVVSCRMIALVVRPSIFCFFFFQAEDGIRDLTVTGVQTCALPIYLAAERSRVAVVVLTALGDEETRQRSLQAGAVAFLKKPFHSDVLCDAVRAALD